MKQKSRAELVAENEKLRNDVARLEATIAKIKQHAQEIESGVGCFAYDETSAEYYNGRESAARSILDEI